MELKTALVVDDSKVARFGLIKILKKRGLEVDSAESGLEALTYLETKKPDVIFMDFFMPGMDGPDATRAIRAKPETASIPVVMCTSKESIQDQTDAKRAGVDAFMTKPATQESLDHVLESLLPRKTLTIMHQAHAVAAEMRPEVKTNFSEADMRQIAEEVAHTQAEQVAHHVAESIAKRHAKAVAEEVAQVIAQEVARKIAKETVDKANTDHFHTIEDHITSRTEEILEKHLASDKFTDAVESIAIEAAELHAEQIAKIEATQQAHQSLAKETNQFVKVMNDVIAEKVRHEFNTQRWVNFVLGIVASTALIAAFFLSR